jgi:hypothetical protein
MNVMNFINDDNKYDNLLRSFLTRALIGQKPIEFGSTEIHK